LGWKCLREPVKDGEVIDVETSNGNLSSAFLLEALAMCVLPNSAGGHGAIAYYIATDQRLLHADMVAILQQRLAATTPTNNNNNNKAAEKDNYDEQLLSCLARLMVVRCHCASDLLAAVCALPSQVLVQEVRLVVIDSLNAFLWQERNGHVGTATVAAVAGALTRVIEQSGAVVIATRIIGGGGGEGNSLMSTVGKEWSDKVTRRVVVDGEGKGVEQR